MKIAIKSPNLSFRKCLGQYGMLHNILPVVFVVVVGVIGVGAIEYSRAATPVGDSGSSDYYYKQCGARGNNASINTAKCIAKVQLGWRGKTWVNDYYCLNDIYSRESSWRYNAENASGAYGIPQALPGSKMGTAGSNWHNNAATQIKWGLSYIAGRYGTPCDAWTFWKAHGWYGPEQPASGPAIIYKSPASPAA